MGLMDFGLFHLHSGGGFSVHHWFGSLSLSLAAPALAASPCSLTTLDWPLEGQGG